MRAACASLAVLLALVDGSAASAAGSVRGGEALLQRAKAVFRAHVRPPFVVYTLRRTDTVDGLRDFVNSYDLKIWCRLSDRRALLRRTWNGHAYGPPDGVVLAFDERVDPGPPDADIFERALFAPHAAAAQPSPSPSPAPEPDATALPAIGAIAIVADADYRVTRLERESELVHLALEPKRDEGRNRIDDLWLDATTLEVRRARLRDHLYLGLTGQSIAQEFDVRFTDRAGLPLIASIHAQSADGLYETEYVYGAVTFPETLPAWYFEPAAYGKHRADEPD